MIMAIDIGNTNTGIAVVEGKRVLKRESVETGAGTGCYEKRVIKAFSALVSEERLHGKTGRAKREKRNIKQSLTNANTAIAAAIICSVVPKATTVVARCVKKVFDIVPEVVGKSIIVPIDNQYAQPKQVGQDRLVCAYAAVELYGSPAVVVDLGTAITVDAVSLKKEYLGGMIVPGIRLSAEALYDKTALLPKVEICKPNHLIGKTTEESILSGIFYGYGEMIKGLIGLLSKQLKQKPSIVVTGGYSDLMKKYVSRYRCFVDKDLIYKGMASLL
ncbi:MAG: type III pantothenate kinase [Candidatus Omnitrophota bacterium]